MDGKITTAFTEWLRVYGRNKIAQRFFLAYYQDARWSDTDVRPVSDYRYSAEIEERRVWEQVISVAAGWRRMWRYVKAIWAWDAPYDCRTQVDE